MSIENLSIDTNQNQKKVFLPVGEHFVIMSMAYLAGGKRKIVQAYITKIVKIGKMKASLECIALDIEKIFNSNAILSLENLEKFLIPTKKRTITTNLSVTKSYSPDEYFLDSRTYTRDIDSFIELYNTLNLEQQFYLKSYQMEKELSDLSQTLKKLPCNNPYSEEVIEATEKYIQTINDIKSKYDSNQNTSIKASQSQPKMS